MSLGVILYFLHMRCCSCHRFASRSASSWLSCSSSEMGGCLAVCLCLQALPDTPILLVLCTSTQYLSAAPVNGTCLARVTPTNRWLKPGAGGAGATSSWIWRHSALKWIVPWPQACSPACAAPACAPAALARCSSVTPALSDARLSSSRTLKVRAPTLWDPSSSFSITSKLISCSSMKWMGIITSRGNSDSSAPSLAAESKLIAPQLIWRTGCSKNRIRNGGEKPSPWKPKRRSTPLGWRPSVR
mmetsp:Transcript_59580/g.181932  ORF Transcript_59580/g.181932 Transcript_59580/m.181932 type:complete len:244 (-) Transcript_59580:790-1521(-)